MRRLFAVFAFACLSIPLFAQNLATVSANNIADVAGNKLASGQLCFLATDQNDNPISFQVGGGGQVIRRTFCSTVTAGAAATFTVPSSASVNIATEWVIRYATTFIANNRIATMSTHR